MNKTISQNRLLNLLAILAIGIIISTGILLKVDNDSLFLGLSLLGFVTIITLFRFNSWLEWVALVISVLVYGYTQYTFQEDLSLSLIHIASFIGAILIAYIPSRAINREISFFINQYSSTNDLIEDLTLHDSLGLIKWHFFLKKLNEEFVRSRRTDTPVSVMMVRLLNYADLVSEGNKKQAEKLMGEFATISQRILRTIDTISRCNQETLSMILPETSDEEAKIAASRVINGIAQQANAAVYTGIATFPNDAVSVEKLISRVEVALEFAVSSEKEQVSYTQLNGSDHEL
ncbi:MAG: diguanylate cyclase [Anaerolineaceae bacterium]|nr:diguanylate cyclase [Anaerolineaceae bacterium]